MPSRLKIIKNINWDKLEMFNEINIIADVIILDIKNGVRMGTDIRGNQFQELASSTLFAKKLNNQPTTPLYGTGLMHKVFKNPSATKSSLIARVSVPKSKNRTNIGMYHNEGTDPYVITPKKAKLLSFPTRGGRVRTKRVNHPGLPKREWFGISEVALDKIRTELGYRLAEKLRQRRQVITK